MEYMSHSCRAVTLHVLLAVIYTMPASPDTLVINTS